MANYFIIKGKWRGKTAHHPDHARNRSRPKPGMSLTKLNINVYIMTVGSATPNISKGWPPIIECMIPQSAVDAKVWTAVRTPSADQLQGEHIWYKKKKVYDLIDRLSQKRKNFFFYFFYRVKCFKIYQYFSQVVHQMKWQESQMQRKCKWWEPESCKDHSWISQLGSLKIQAYDDFGNIYLKPALKPPLQSCL